MRGGAALADLAAALLFYDAWMQHREEGVYALFALLMVIAFTITLTI